MQRDAAARGSSEREIDREKATERKRGGARKERKRERERDNIYIYIYIYINKYIERETQSPEPHAGDRHLADAAGGQQLSVQDPHH